MVSCQKGFQPEKSSGFGRCISWTEDKTPPKGHSLTFKECMHIVSTDIFLKLVFPRPILSLTSHLRRVRDGFDELDEYMLEMIQERRAEREKSGSSIDDLFGGLLKASDAEGGGITDRELIGKSRAHCC